MLFNKLSKLIGTSQIKKRKSKINIFNKWIIFKYLKYLGDYANGKNRNKSYIKAIRNLIKLKKCL